MLKYMVISDRHVSLEDQINKLLKEDWELQGGVSIADFETPEGMSIIQFQALIKKLPDVKISGE